MADFQQHKPEFDALDTRIVALSADSEADAARTREKLGLDFSLSYGLDAEAAALAIGCYTGTREGCAHVQPAGFVLRPDGTIALAVYSSGKVGRLYAKDAVTLLRDLAPASREAADSR